MNVTTWTREKGKEHERDREGGATVLEFCFLKWQWWRWRAVGGRFGSPRCLTLPVIGRRAALGVEGFCAGHGWSFLPRAFKASMTAVITSYVITDYASYFCLLAENRASLFSEFLKSVRLKRGRKSLRIYRFTSVNQRVNLNVFMSLFWKAFSDCWKSFRLEIIADTKAVKRRFQSASFFKCYWNQLGSR